MEGRLDVFRVLMDCDKTDINIENDAGRTALWFALNYQKPRYEEMVDLLLRRNASTDFIDVLGVNALILSASSPAIKNEEYMISITEGSAFILSAPPPAIKNKEEYTIPITEALINKNVAVDLKEITNGTNALGLAIENGNEGVVRSLLEHERSIVLADLANYDNATPLAIAAKQGNLSIVRCLLEQKVAVNSQTINERRTPLMFAAAAALT